MPFRDLTWDESLNTEIVNVKKHGARGNGTYDDSSAITTAINEANDGTLLFPLGTYKIGSNVTVPSNLTIWFTNGAKLNIDSGVTFTINGKLNAGLGQIFSGSGTVVIAKGVVESLVPQWWGATGDGSNDDTSAFTTCITCAETTSISIIPSNYKITNDITFGITSNVRLIAPVNFTVSTGKTVTFSGRMFGDIPTLAGAGALIYSSAIINRDTRSVALIYTGTIACNTDLGEIFTTTTVNETGNATIDASGGIKGKKITFLITNDGTSNKTITFNTGFLPNGTLIGTVSKTVVVEFVYDGSLWQEVSRAIPNVIKNNQDVSTTGTPSLTGLTVNGDITADLETPINDVTHPDYGAHGNGTDDDRDHINTAQTLMGVGKAIYLPSGTYKISSNLTISSDIIFASGAKLSIDNTKVVTITGNINAPLQQIFSGLGTVSLIGNTKIEGVYPQWWGAVGDGMTNDTTAIQATVDSSTGTVFLIKGTFTIIDTITISKSLSMVGAGQSTTVLKYKDGITVGSNKPLIKITGTAIVNTVIKSFTIDGNTANTTQTGQWNAGIYITTSGSDPISKIWVSDMYIKNVVGDGITIGGYPLYTESPTDIFVTDCIIENWKTDRQGVAVTNGKRVMISRNHFFNHTGTGFAVDLEPDGNLGQNITDIIISDNIMSSSRGYSATAPGSSLTTNILICSNLVTSATPRSIGSNVVANEFGNIITAGQIDIYGNEYISGTLGVGIESPVAIIEAYKSSIVTNANLIALQGQIAQNVASAWNMTGVLGRVDPGNSSGTLFTAIGIAGQIYQWNAGTTSNATAAQGSLRNVAGGTITNAIGLEASISNTSTGTLTSAYGVKVNDAVNSGGGTINTSYGVYIGDQLGTTQYGLYQTGSTDKNYFAGNLGVGTTVPLAKVAINGGLAVGEDADPGDNNLKVVGNTTTTNLQVTGYVYFDEEVDNGNSSTADTINWTAGNKQKSTLTGNCTFTFTAPSGPCNLTLRLIQDSTGSRLVTWPATVKWAGGIAPTLSTSIGAIDIVNFYWNGTYYYATALLAFN